MFHGTKVHIFSTRHISSSTTRLLRYQQNNLQAPIYLYNRKSLPTSQLCAHLGGPFHETSPSLSLSFSLISHDPAMSLVNLSHVCSHLQNASRARLGLTSIPLSNLHLSLSLQLQKAGFFSHVIRGGPEPPDLLETNDTPEPITQANISSRRIWLGLKYWNNEPVLSRMTMISRPTRRIWMDQEGLARIVKGRDHAYVKGLRDVGEMLYVTTDRGVLEARECVERRIGGMILCRVL